MGMRWLLFLFRLSLICGLFFLLALSLLVWDWIADDSLVSTIVTIGYFMGMLLVPITLLLYAALSLAGRRPGMVVPRWLLFAVVLVLLTLAAYILYVNQVYSSYYL
ncbi:MAG: hypothetical protein RJA57_622 [Bacteroidota bacterium]|jgi:hypothetical protein